MCVSTPFNVKKCVQWGGGARAALLSKAEQLQVPTKKYRTNTNIEHHFFSYVIQINIYWSVSDMGQEIKIMR